MPALPETEPAIVLVTVSEVVEAVMALRAVAKRFVEVAWVEVALVVIVSVSPRSIARLGKVVVEERRSSKRAPKVLV